jgi:hypothetical protein
MAGMVSAVSWYDGSAHLRVYTSNGSQVTEQGWDGSWYTGQFSAAGNTVGATSWQSNGQIYIRVYVAQNNNIVEYCWDGSGWYTGAYKGQGTGATATAWVDSAGQNHIRVYARSSSGTFSEQCWDGSGWYNGAYPGA